MTDLRTRIAAALFARAIERIGWNRSWDNLSSPSRQSWLDDADAVIRELQLTILGDGIVVGAIHE